MEQKRALEGPLNAEEGPAGPSLPCRESPFTSTAPYPPTDCTAVLSAMAGLTAEFGMGSGDPCLHGRAREGYSRGAPPGALAAA